MNKQVLIVQVFLKVGLLFGEVGGKRRVEQGGAPGRQNSVSDLEHTNTNANLRGAAVKLSRGTVSDNLTFTTIPP